MQPSDRIENRAAGIDVEHVAELVRLWRRDGLDARAQMARVVSPCVAAPDGPQQVAKGAVAKEVEGLVGHFELHLARILTESAAGPLSVLALPLEIGCARDEALLHHALDDLLDKIVGL